jgi:hypothetical protein
MKKLLEFGVSFLLIPLMYAFGYESLLFISANVEFARVASFLYGFLAYTVFHVALGSKLIFIQIFEHELGHTLVALVFGRGIREFAVHSQGGEVEYRGTSNLFIRLAPYYLPVFTLPLLVVKPFVLLSTYGAINFLIGFTLAFHYLALTREFRLDQTDIVRVGPVLAFCVTFIMNIIFLVIILSLVIGDHAILLDYFEASFTRALDFCQAVLQQR